MGLPFNNKAKQSSVLERRPEEGLKVLGSRPIVDLDLAMVKLQKLHTLVIYFGYRIVLPL